MKLKFSRRLKRHVPRRPSHLIPRFVEGNDAPCRRVRSPPGVREIKETRDLVDLRFVRFVPVDLQLFTKRNRAIPKSGSYLEMRGRIDVRY